jgi:hypothetical protein
MLEKMQLTMNDFQEWKMYKEVIERRGLASIENGKSGFG